MKILVVDDDNVTRKLLGLYLKSKGYELTFAENGLDTSQSSPVEISIWYSLTSTCPTWTDWSSSGI